MNMLQSKATYLDSSKEGVQTADEVESTGSGSGRNSTSTTPNRKRPYPTSFISDDEVPPNKRIHTPTVSSFYIRNGISIVLGNGCQVMHVTEQKWYRILNVHSGTSDKDCSK